MYAESRLSASGWGDISLENGPPRRAAAHAGPVTMLLPTDPTTRWWTYSEGFEVILIGSRLHFNEMATYARQKLCIWRRRLAPDAEGAK